MLLLNAILNPMIPHVDAFRSFDLEGVVGKAYCTCVVGEEKSWRLVVAEGEENSAESGGHLANVEQGSVFGFGGGRDYDVDYGGEGMDGSIERCVRGRVVDQVGDAAGD